MWARAMQMAARACPEVPEQKAPEQNMLEQIWSRGGWRKICMWDKLQRVVTDTGASKKLQRLVVSQVVELQILLGHDQIDRNSVVHGDFHHTLFGDHQNIFFTSRD